MLFLATPEMPPMPVNEAVVVAAAPSNTIRTMNYGVCKFIQAWSESGAYDKGFNVQLGPQYAALNLLPKEFRDRVTSQSPTYEDSALLANWEDSIVIKRLSEPEHGTMLDKDRYIPNKGYIGKDRVDFLLEGKDLNGQPFSMKVKYYINVISESQLDSAIKNDNSYQQALKKYCGTTTATWRVADNADSSTADAATVFTLNSLAGFDGYDYLTPIYTFTNLPGTAVGQTTGEGSHRRVQCVLPIAPDDWKFAIFMRCNALRGLHPTRAAILGLRFDNPTQILFMSSGFRWNNDIR